MNIKKKVVNPPYKKGIDRFMFDNEIITDDIPRIDTDIDIIDIEIPTINTDIDPSIFINDLEIK